MKELRRFTRLTQLSIKCQRAMDGCVTAALPSLPQLQHLQLNGRSLPAGLPAALRHLSQLTRLSCRSREQLPGLSAVLALSRLRMLGTWEEERWDGMLQPDVHEMLARLQHLESWAFESLGKEEYTGSMQVGDAILLSCSVTGYNRASGTVQHLMLNGVRELSSLQQLMAGLLPARSPPVQLHSLAMYGSCLTLQAVQNCSFLEHLTSLEIHGRIGSTGSANVVVAALLGQAAKLRKLCLQAMWLDDLPPTPCLASLESLDLSQNCFKKLPAGLLAATRLTALSLDGNRDLELTKGDVKRVLLRLPALQRLRLKDTRTERTCCST